MNTSSLWTGTLLVLIFIHAITMDIDALPSLEGSVMIETSQALAMMPYCFIAPLVCPTKNVRFYLYTSANPNSFTELSVAYPESIKKAPFVRGPVKIIFHGYTGYANYTPNTQIRPAYLKSGKIVNVITVDYGPLVRDGCYITAVQNTQVAAKCTAQFIEYIVKLRKDIKLSQIHLIGLSLGAQVCGQIADFLKIGQIQRISALDAALPFFYPFLTPPSRRIHKGDAKRIDALHTNSYFAGQDLPYADCDFYANGGVFQPGCAPLDLKCDHERSADLFAESINSPTGFRAHSCYFPPPLTAGQCVEKGSPTVPYGEYVDPNATGIYAFNTASRPPYALP